MTASKLRRLKPRAYRPGPFDKLTADEHGLLFDGKVSAVCEFVFTDVDIDVAALWAKHREAVLAAWAEDHPGTRPSLWWRYDAPRWKATGHRVAAWYVAELPEPRLRLGGTGKPIFERYAYVPTWPFGVPDYWHSISETDPPRFESEASYLRRHGLFLEGEEGRLTEGDFELEVIDQRSSTPSSAKRLREQRQKARMLSGGGSASRSSTARPR